MVGRTGHDGIGTAGWHAVRRSVGGTDVVGRVPAVEGWDCSSAGDVLVGVPVDLEHRVGQGFVPNIHARVLALEASSDDETAPSGLAVVQRDAGDPMVTKTLLASAAGRTVVFQLGTRQVTTVGGEPVAFVVTCSAGQEDWPAVAAAFDEIVDGATLGVEETR